MANKCHDFAFMKIIPSISDHIKGFWFEIVKPIPGFDLTFRVSNFGCNKRKRRMAAMRNSRMKTIRAPVIVWITHLTS